MHTVYKNQTYIDLAYNLGNSKQNRKLIIENTKIYIFVGNDILIFVFGKVNSSIRITQKTKIDDVIDFTLQIVGENTVDITECDIENLIVDRVENIYYTLLTEDDQSIVILEDYFDTVPKDGDLVDRNLNVLEQETKNKKSAINDKFQSLIKR